MTDRRLIEAAFPLEQTSIDSVHEKNVRHGHISTLHIWPARRPLAACRAALIATLLPDPGTKEAREELCKRIGGTVVKVIRKKQGPGGGKKEEKVVRETMGGILHWGREAENKADLDFFREEIRKAYGGRAPRVLDPFAGGGAIPLEAMRLGCEVTAIDINPVAWFILKCTLEYPQRLADQKRPLPEFVRRDRTFMEAFFKAHGFKGAGLRSQLRKLGLEDEPAPGTGGQPTLKDTHSGKDVDLQIEEHTLEADLAWHVRAWGWWVLREARKELAPRYPVYADFEPLKDAAGWRAANPTRPPMRLVPLTAEGEPDIAPLNRDVSPADLVDTGKPRWVAKPVVAYLWARTVRCKNCRAVIPLLKTRWLAKKGSKRVVLTMRPNDDRTGVVFGVETDVPSAGGNNAQKREHDRRIGQGTMSRSGAWCPCCGKPGTVAMEMEDIRAEGLAERLGVVMTAVVADAPEGKAYRRPTEHEVAMAAVLRADLDQVFMDVPFGVPDEPLPDKEALGIRVPLYGLDRWSRLFLNRQLLGLGVIVRETRAVSALSAESHAGAWRDAVTAYLALAIGRAANYMSSLCLWDSAAGEVKQTFLRFALPITWDFAEANPLADVDRYYRGGLSKIERVLSALSQPMREAPAPTIRCQSAAAQLSAKFDVIITDPPYYDAIPYSDLMDFFYVWLRRSLTGLPGVVGDEFLAQLGPKWNHDRQDGELIDDASRFQNDAARSIAAYEMGMANVFKSCANVLVPNGRFVVVFANKQPRAWEKLVAAAISGGFVVVGSLPIATEMRGGIRNLARASLSSSIWLVCKHRDAQARPGWDTAVVQEMRTNINTSLRAFWDAGIRGPDFVWAATGPALEAYSRHPIVKKANEPNALMSVSEFLGAVRRLVVEFVVGRVLSEVAAAPTGVAETGAAALDDVTTYYLLHRHDFHMEDAPAGACILYALSCNLSERELAGRYDVLVRTGGKPAEEDDESEAEDADSDDEGDEGTGSTFRLKSWKRRRRPSLGLDPVADNARARRLHEQNVAAPLFEETAPAAPRQRMIPLIDMVHRLMHLWSDGDVAAVNEYIDLRGLRRSEPFRQVLQAVIELSPEGSEERSVAERVMNHLRARGDAPAPDLLARAEQS